METIEGPNYDCPAFGEATTSVYDETITTVSDEATTTL